MLRDLIHPAGARHEFFEEHADEARVICVLVHGTFAPSAPWTLPGSTFRQSIERGLKRCGRVRFCRFIWRGRWRTGLNNSHRDRLEGGVVLGDCLRQLIKANPEVPIVLAGHSHGGSVIMYALAEAQELSRIAAVVTMGTPFFQFRARRLSEILAPVQFITGSAISVPLLFAAIYLNRFWEVESWWLGWLIVIVIVYGGYLAVLPLIRWAHRKAARATSRWKRAMARIATRRCGVPLFAASTPFDEAWHWLLLGAFIPQLPLALAFPAGVLLNPLIGIPLIVFGGALGALPLAIAAFIGAFIFPAVWFITWMIRGSPIFFGGETLAGMMVGDLRIVRQPPQVAAVDVSKEYRSETCFAHSVYDYRKFRWEMVRWLRRHISDKC